LSFGRPAMKFPVPGIGEVECTPEELVRLIALGAFSRRANGVEPLVRNGTYLGGIDAQHEAPISAPRAGAHQETELNREVFFRDITPFMAAIMLAHMNHDGRIRQSQLLSETGIQSGLSLRRPNGALNRRVRDASSCRIPGFCKVEEADRTGAVAERVFVTNPEVLAFMRANTQKITELAATRD
jgi:hypothetical protein